MYLTVYRMLVKIKSNDLVFQLTLTAKSIGDLKRRLALRNYELIKIIE